MRNGPVRTPAVPQEGDGFIGEFFVLVGVGFRHCRKVDYASVANGRSDLSTPVWWLHQRGRPRGQETGRCARPNRSMQNTETAALELRRLPSGSTSGDLIRFQVIREESGSPLGQHAQPLLTAPQVYPPIAAGASGNLDNCQYERDTISDRVRTGVRSGNSCCKRVSP